MNRFSRLAAAAFLAAIIALPLSASAFAADAPMHGDNSNTVVYQEGHGGESTTQAQPTSEVKTRVTWMIVGVAGAAVVMGLLYMFKRRIGGFPKNPSWVAPITIMASSDLPGDVDSHEADSHGHQPASSH